jgi:hypothetical protein
VGGQAARGPSGSGLIGPSSGFAQGQLFVDSLAFLPSPSPLHPSPPFSGYLLPPALWGGAEVLFKRPPPGPASRSSGGDPLLVSLSHPSQGGGSAAGQRGRTGC